MNNVPNEVKEQAIYQKDFNCAQILYRTLVHAGPADKLDRQFTQYLLVNPRVIEVGKLHHHLIRWKFAKERLHKYGFRNPDESLLFETLKAACKSLRERDTEFAFRLDSFILEDDSVN